MSSARLISALVLLSYACALAAVPSSTWLKDAAAKDLDQVTLFLFNTPGREFPSVDELRALAGHRGVDLIAMSGVEDAPAFRQRLAAIVGESGSDNVELRFCGPSGLLQRVRSEMALLGVPDARLRFERFEFR